MLTYKCLCRKWRHDAALGTFAVVNPQLLAHGGSERDARPGTLSRPPPGGAICHRSLRILTGIVIQQTTDHFLVRNLRSRRCGALKKATLRLLSEIVTFTPSSFKTS